MPDIKFIDAGDVPVGTAYDKPIQSGNLRMAYGARQMGKSHMALLINLRHMEIQLRDFAVRALTENHDEGLAYEARYAANHLRTFFKLLGSSESETGDKKPLANPGTVEKPNPPG